MVRMFLSNILFHILEIHHLRLLSIIQLLLGTSVRDDFSFSSLAGALSPFTLSLFSFLNLVLYFKQILVELSFEGINLMRLIFILSPCILEVAFVKSSRWLN